MLYIKHDSNKSGRPPQKKKKKANILKQSQKKKIRTESWWGRLLGSIGQWRYQAFYVERVKTHGPDRI